MRVTPEATQPRHTIKVHLNDPAAETELGLLLRWSLQGDVGSGKTAVAFLFVMMALASGQPRPPPPPPPVYQLIRVAVASGQYPTTASLRPIPAQSALLPLLLPLAATWRPCSSHHHTVFTVPTKCCTGAGGGRMTRAVKSTTVVMGQAEGLAACRYCIACRHNDDQHG